MTRLSITACVVALIGVTSLAHAENSDQAAPPNSWHEAVARTTATGSYLPLSLTPSVGVAAAQASGFGGYDSAKGSAVMESFAEARLYGPLALRFGAKLNADGEEVGPFIGARLQLLSEERQGVAGAVALFYKAEGFDEPEGELEGVLSLGKRVGRVLLIGNLAYGQDGEGNERDGELRAATLVEVAPWAHLGVDARGRFDLGSNRDKLRATNEPIYDLDAGPVLNLALGPLAFVAHGGISVVRRLDRRAEPGAVVLGGLGTAF